MMITIGMTIIILIIPIISNCNHHNNIMIDNTHDSNTNDNNIEHACQPGLGACGDVLVQITGNSIKRMFKLRPHHLHVV